ncbi:MAG: histidine kinase [Oscillospiraceae bacterium]|nr:histidine kinase [Oscillospiraceae bacterium]
MYLVGGVLNLFCCCLGVMILSVTHRGKRRRSGVSIISRWTFMFCTVMLGCSGTALCFFRANKNMEKIYFFLTTCFYIFFYMTTASYTYYIAEVYEVRQERMAKILIGISNASCFLGLIMWSANSVTPYFYDMVAMEATNPILYKLGSVPGAISVLIDIALVILYRDKGEMGSFSLAIWPLFPLLSSIVGHILPGVSFTSALMFASILFNHFRFDEVLDARREDLEREKEELQLRMTFERVKPHYIYNVLTSIYYLCEQDAKKAQHAIGVFSDYLRKALHVMEHDETVPFSTELQMIENYFELEKMRFGDRIQVVYDIQEKDFAIPPFTVQPLIENAVKHGSNGKDVVTIHLTTERKEGGYLVTVLDNGVGMTPDDINKEGSSGIRNIHNLLSLRKCGTLRVDSEKGAGTKAT